MKVDLRMIKPEAREQAKGLEMTASGLLRVWQFTGEKTAWQNWNRADLALFDFCQDNRIRQEGDIDVRSEREIFLTILADWVRRQTAQGPVLKAGTYEDYLKGGPPLKEFDADFEKAKEERDECDGCDDGEYYACRTNGRWHQCEKRRKKA